ncbi:MAG: tetratricopeptide repeat protein [Deltaproteobacteria bacterium]|nr:tetratricopeptide repeat protein [Deltaproteobacteria bacterium]
MKNIILSLLILFPSSSFAHSETEQEMMKFAMLGARESSMGNYKAGAEFFAKAFKELKKQQLYSLMLISVRLMGKRHLAASLCSRSPAPALKEHSYHYWCARTYWETGDKKGALKFIDNAISLGGNLPHYLATGALMNQSTDRKKAIRYLKALVQKDPWLLHTWLVPNDIAGIILIMEDLYSTYKYKGELYHNLSVMAWKAKLPDMADYYADKAKSQYKTPAPELLELKYRILSLLADSTTLRTFLKKAIRQHPEGTGLNFIMAEIAMEKKNYSVALKFLKKLLKKEPDSGLILSKLARCYLETGNSVKADKYFRYALKQNYEAPHFKFSYGLFFQRQGNFKKALELIKAARDSDITNEYYQSAYIAILQTLGKKKEVALEMNRLNALKKAIIWVKTKETDFRKSWLKLKNSIHGKNKLCTTNHPVCTAHRIYSILKKGGNADPLLNSLLTSYFRAKLFTSSPWPNSATLNFSLSKNLKSSVSVFYYSLHPSILKP